MRRNRLSEWARRRSLFRSSRVRCASACLLVACAWLDPTRAKAEPPIAVAPATDDLPAADGGVAAEVIEAARRHFSRGVELYRSAAYDAALAEFSRAYESAPNYRILYNLGQIQAQRHDYVASRELFVRYLEEGGGAVDAERRASVLAELRELERRISRLDVASNVEGAQLFVDDAPAAYLPLDQPLLLNAGIHRLRVEKADHEPAYRSVTLTGGDQVSLTLDPSANIDMDEPALPAPALEPAPPERELTAFWLSLAATAALSSSAVTFGLLTQGADARLERQLAEYPAPRHAVERTRERVELFAGLSDASLALALLGAGCAGYFYFSASSDAPAEGLRASVGSTTLIEWVDTF